ncbi:Peroxidase superfamily protein [Euphorbia peplus]|nr:Peroxidase superfamily protein [Euphorbia peplus]
MKVIILILLALLSNIRNSIAEDGHLAFGYYLESCPLAEKIVRYNVQLAVLKNPRMAASLLRLHFHDCFVMGCDGSVLLDSDGEMISEKEAGPNVNSLRGFEVIDKIKYELEEACPLTVSCADILAIAARDSVTFRGGPRWEVYLGRKDSLKASFDGANEFIPAPNSSLHTLIANFNQQGLDIGDLVALSGSHTMGNARCLSFKQRVYEMSPEEKYEGDKYKRYSPFRRILRSICPTSGSDDQLAPLDYTTPARFDNHYFHNILQGQGLLGSDNVLVMEDEEGEITEKVWAYASNQHLFFQSFANSMLKMGNINVLTGNHGDVRKNCRFLNF